MTGVQSKSLKDVHPDGQQPSPPVQVKIVVCPQATLQFMALPVRESMVQAMPSLQLVGHVLGGSQVSPGSRTPLPHMDEQSLSLRLVQPPGQQPSPPAQLTIGV